MSVFAEEVVRLKEEGSGLESALEVLVLVAQEEGGVSFVEEACGAVLGELERALPSQKAVYVELLDRLVREGGEALAAALAQGALRVLPPAFAQLAPAQQNRALALLRSWAAMAPPAAAAVAPALVQHCLAAMRGMGQVGAVVGGVGGGGMGRGGGVGGGGGEPVAKRARVEVEASDGGEVERVVAFLEAGVIDGKFAGVETVVQAVQQVNARLGVKLASFLDPYVRAEASGMKLDLPRSHPDSEIKALLPVLHEVTGSVGVDENDPRFAPLITQSDPRAMELLTNAMPFVCKEDGLRFGSQEELDVHRRKLLAEMERLKTVGVLTRGWFVDKGDWVARKTSIQKTKGLNFFDLEKIKQDQQLASSSSSASSSPSSPTSPTSPASPTHTVPVADHANACTACGDPFDRRISDTGELEFLNAILVDGKLFHASCIDAAGKGGGE